MNVHINPQKQGHSFIFQWENWNILYSAHIGPEWSQKYRLYMHWKHYISARSEPNQFILIPTSTRLHRNNLGIPVNISFGLYEDLFLEFR